MPEIAVVVGNYEGERYLADCLRSVAVQTRVASEVVVVDATSRDASRDVARAHGARVIEAQNRGLGFLYNRGLEATRAEYVLLSNNDVAYDGNCLERLAGELDRDARRFAADPRQLDWGGAWTIHARTTISRGRLLREFIPGLHLDHVVEGTEVVPTASANGAAMLLRREMFVELGGFDETFFMEWEDLDLCWRAWLRGWPTVYVPAATVRHRVGAVTSTQALPKRLASSHHNLIRFALKCLPPAAAARVVIGEVLRLPAHPRIVAPALLAISRELPEILRLRHRTRPSAAHLRWLLAGMP